MSFKCVGCGLEFSSPQKIRKYCSHSCAVRKKNHPNWKGGITPLLKAIRNSDKYKEWRNQVFERDNYKCQGCGKKSDHDLSAHHIKPFAKIVFKNNFNYWKEALDCSELWDLNNGITLCGKCHEKTDSYLNRW